jgi:uncharacterized membrane protein (DUF485 family)
LLVRVAVTDGSLLSEILFLRNRTGYTQANVMLTSHRLVTYIKQPSLFDSTPYLLAAPFSASLWIRFGLILLLLTFTLSATWYLGDCYVRHKNDEAFTVTVSCFCVFRSFCQQGTYSGSQEFYKHRGRMQDFRTVFGII